LTEPIRVDLEGALKGQHVLLAPDELNIGLIEDVQSGSVKFQIDAITRAIVGGNLVGVRGGAVFALADFETEDEARAAIRLGVRRLKLPEMQALIQGLDGVFELPKVS
jgi:hypothetical protein